MSTVAFNETNYGRQFGIMPQKPDVRQVVREEIHRQKELDKNQERYDAGEISKAEYYINKAVLNLPKTPSFPPTNCNYLA